MPEITLLFILSQIAVFIAMIFDFLSFQFKKRKYTFVCFTISATLISTHYFLLGKSAAGVIVFISAIRFIVSYFKPNKKYLFIFIGLNTLSLLFTYKFLTDLVIYIASLVIITGNFQANDKLMRRIMMLGTSIAIVYNIIIFSPMAAIMETSFLISNFLGYYRHYVKIEKK
ncbi:MAG: YgjV family protein [Patescibacteria group bacterium]